jgi:hypothetical protein
LVRQVLQTLLHEGANPRIKDKAGHDMRDYGITGCQPALDALRDIGESSNISGSNSGTSGIGRAPHRYSAVSPGSPTLQNPLPVHIFVSESWNDTVNGVLYVHNTVVVQASSKDAVIQPVDFRLTLKLENGVDKTYTALNQPGPTYKKVNLDLTPDGSTTNDVPEVQPQSDLGALGSVHVPAGGSVTTTVTFLVSDQVLNSKNNRAVTLRQ